MHAGHPPPSFPQPQDNFLQLQDNLPAAAPPPAAAPRRPYMRALAPRHGLLPQGASLDEMFAPDDLALDPSFFGNLGAGSSSEAVVPFGQQLGIPGLYTANLDGVEGGGEVMPLVVDDEEAALLFGALFGEFGPSTDGNPATDAPAQPQRSPGQLQGQLPGQLPAPELDSAEQGMWMVDDSGDGWGI